MNRRAHRRRRPALSCVECRRRKIKCSRTEPCTQCVSSNHPQCVYHLYNTAPIQAILREQLAGGSLESNQSEECSIVSLPIAQDFREMSTDLSNIDHDGHEKRVSAKDSRPGDINIEDLVKSTGDRNRSLFEPQQNSHNLDLQDLLRKLQVAEEPSANSAIQGLAETSRRIFERQSGLEDSQIVLNKTRILRWSHWMATAPEFRAILTCYSEATGHGDTLSFQEDDFKSMIIHIGTLLSKCKSVATSIKLERPIRGPSNPAFGLILPPREVSDRMVNLYFCSFESTTRILHVPTFWAEYRKYWDQQDAVAPDVRLMIFLVVGIGSSLSEWDTDFRELVRQWVYDAEAWLSGPLHKNRLSITGLQIYCLSILARQIFSIGGDLVWMSIGSLVHRAMQIGLHRDPHHLPRMSHLQAELRRRLWATIIEMSIQSSMDSAMPPRISLDEFDTTAPSNFDDDQIHDTTSTIDPQPLNHYTMTSLQIALCRSMATRLQIAQVLTNLRSELSYVGVLSLSSKMSDHYRVSGAFTDANKTVMTSFHRNLLNYTLRRSTIPLHCSFALQARVNPLYHYSLKSCLDATMLILSPEPDDCFACLMSTGGGLFREVIREAGSIISLELLAQTNAQQLDGTLHSASKYRDGLKVNLKDMIQLSLRRIQEGETNMKSHTFLSMILAQVEAIENDTSCELSIARSAQVSLELCLKILQSQLDQNSFTSACEQGLRLPGPYDDQDIFGLDLDMDFFPAEGGFE